MSESVRVIVSVWVRECVWVSVYEKESVRERERERMGVGEREGERDGVCVRFWRMQSKHNYTLFVQTYATVIYACTAHFPYPPLPVARGRRDLASRDLLSEKGGLLDIKKLGKELQDPKWKVLFLKFLYC